MATDLEETFACNFVINAERCLNVDIMADLS